MPLWAVCYYFVVLPKSAQSYYFCAFKQTRFLYALYGLILSNVHA